jgi:starch synthase (maltosyl-transferring)
MSNAASALPRLVIEHVTPELDSGRYPVKRALGETVRVEADIFKDGHDEIAGQLLFRNKSQREWQRIPLNYQFDPDRWHAEFKVDQLGIWQYVVEAWPDKYGTWVRDLAKRLSAGQNVVPALAEGSALLQLCAKHRAQDVAARLQAASQRMLDTSLRLDERVAIAQSAEVRALVYGPLIPDDATRSERILEVRVERELALFGAWYELFPRSQSKIPGRHGTFADVEERLPELAALGFDVIYLPPIHPIGKTHRKGRNNAREALPADVGSPWAIGAAEGGHLAVHPDLGTVADFDQLVATAREFGLEIALDYALQCSPDHPWVKQHPEWFFIRADGSIQYAENPPKKYEDIYPINFWCDDRENLWKACLEIFLFWISHGVKVFRVDNPHTKPFAFWEWVLGKVQDQHPDVIFLSESFTRPKRMKNLLKLGFSQSYTYFTWKNAAWEVRDYLTELTSAPTVEFFRPNFFANTPDILHAFLQTGGRPAFRIRLLLAATLSPSYGIYSGFELCENRAVATGSEEYLNSEKYEIRQRKWNQFGNIKQDIAKLNRIRRENPAFSKLGNVRFLTTEYEQILAYHKYLNGNDLIVVVNLDPTRMHECMVHLPLQELGLREDQMFEVEDLLTGVRHTWRGSRNYVRLDPSERVGHVLRLVRSR